MPILDLPRSYQEAIEYLKLREEYTAYRYEYIDNNHCRVYDKYGKLTGTATADEIIQAAGWLYYCYDGFTHCPYCGAEFPEEDRLNSNMQCANCAGYTAEGD